MFHINLVTYIMEILKTHQIVIYNDDEHSFQYIMASLIKFCEHHPHQAEQCAMIAHSKGKCIVKSGEFNEILEIHEKLNRLEIKSDIEDYASDFY